MKISYIACKYFNINYNFMKISYIACKYLRSVHITFVPVLYRVSLKIILMVIPSLVTSPYSHNIILDYQTGL